MANYTHRCAPGNATERYFLFGSTAFVDTETGKLQSFEAARTTCFSGFFPANGLYYFHPAHHCICYPMLRGFIAYAPAAEASATSRPAGARAQLVRGPAFGGDFRCEFAQKRAKEGPEGRVLG